MSSAIVSFSPSISAGPPTFALSSRLECQLHELQLVDLVGELEDEDIVEGQALGCAARVAEELDEGIRELVPQLALPEVLEVENERLQIVRRLVSLVREEVWDRVDVHPGGAERREARVFFLYGPAVFWRAGDRVRLPVIEVRRRFGASWLDGDVSLETRLWEPVGTSHLPW